MYKSITALAVVGTLGLATATRAEPITLDPSRVRAARRPSIAHNPGATANQLALAATAEVKP